MEYALPDVVGEGRGQDLPCVTENSISGDIFDHGFI